MKNTHRKRRPVFTSQGYAIVECGACLAFPMRDDGSEVMHEFNFLRTCDDCKDRLCRDCLPEGATVCNGCQHARDNPLAVLALGQAQELPHGEAETASDHLEVADGDVLLPALNGADVVPVEAERIGEALLAVPGAPPEPAHDEAEALLEQWTLL